MKRMGQIKMYAGLGAMVFFSFWATFSWAAGEMDNMSSMKMPMQNQQSDEKVTQVPVTLSAQKQQLIGVKSEEVQVKPLLKQVRAFGHVDYDERKLSTITTKFEGWIEALGIDATGMPVKKGEMLFSVYSPKLVQAQEEYLMGAKTAQNGGRALTEASRKRLLLWDVTPAQIQTLRKNGEVLRAMPILSPASGVVIEKMALAGMYVQPGMPLYKIADLSRVWLYVDLYENDLSLAAEGQAVTVHFPALPGEVWESHIAKIYPYLNEASRTATLRVELENSSGKLKPGMIANVLFRAKKGEGLVVPENAVLDSGMRQMTFVAKDGGRFEPREIRIGKRFGNEIEILEGLKAGESVVTHGTFLIDSESKLMASMEGMMGLIGMGDWKMEGSKMGEMDMGEMDMGGMKMSQNMPSQVSENTFVADGLKLSLSTEPAMPKKGDTVLKLKVEQVSGQAVADATVVLDYTMAMPGMEVERLAAKSEKNGTYSATAFFGMKGVWEIEARVSRPNQAPVHAKFKIRVGG